MKTKPVPTSPKVRNKKDIVEDIYNSGGQKSFDKPRIKQRNGVLILVLAILSGFFAGIFGETIVNALAVAYPNLPVISSLYVRTYPNEGNVLIVKNEKTIEAQELQVLNTLSQIQPAVVTVFEKKSVNPGGADLLDDNYQFGNALGNALILTNDGLLVTTNQIVTDAEKEYVAVTSDRKIYLAEKVIRDSATNLVFFRISATNLSIVEFINPQDLHIGQQVLALSNKVNGNYESEASTIRDLLYYPDNELIDIIYSSEKLNDQIKITDSLPEVFLGGPLVTNDGKVVGIATADRNNVINQILPGEYIQKIIPGILTDGTPGRVYFGTNYIDLSRTTQLDVSTVGENKVGALLYGNDSLSITAVESGSPAEKAGLMKDDIITAVDGREISNNDSLSEIIQNYKAGDKVDIQYIRSGEKLTLPDVTLTEE
ncbi:MAG: S1C family serine protease [Patescibacteria group bacterium]